MAEPYTAILAHLHVSPTAGGAGAYTDVGLMNSLSIDEKAVGADTTVFGATWIKKDQTLQSATFSGGGFFDYYNDTTGQKYVMDNAVNGAVLWMTLLYGETTYYVKSQVNVTDFTIKTRPEGMIEWSFSADSTGTITHGS